MLSTTLGRKSLITFGAILCVVASMLQVGSDLGRSVIESVLEGGSTIFLKIQVHSKHLNFLLTLPETSNPLVIFLSYPVCLKVHNS